jgi:hypothetical protein
LPTPRAEAALAEAALANAVHAAAALAEAARADAVLAAAALVEAALADEGWPARRLPRPAGWDMDQPRVSDAENARETRSRRGAWLRASSRWAACWPVWACVAVVFALGAPMIVYCPHGASSCQLSLTHLGTTADQRYFAALWETTRVTLRDFHQLPSWNPYHCGGIVLYQDPQAPFPGPLFLLTFFWLPTAVGLKVWVFAHLLCGALGARALVADRGGNAAEQVLAGVLMACCGFVAEHIGGGHLAFTPFLFLPLILWALRRALRDVRYAVAVAALLALADIEGGTYPVPLMAVAVAIECLARLGSASDRRALARALPLVAVLFVLLAGVRMVPVLHYLREHPRLMPLDDRISLAEVFGFWTTGTHGRAVAGHQYVWPEYDCYVGVVPVALMLAGVSFALFGRNLDQGRRERRIDLTLFAALVWCALGNVAGPSLFGLLHRLPIYASLRVPSRFLGPAMVGFGLLAAGALSAGRGVLVRRGAGVRVMRVALLIELGLVAGVVLDVCLTNQRVIQQGIDPVLSASPARADFFQNSGASYAEFATFPVAGFGTRSCYVPLEWKPAPGLVDGRVPQARLEPPSAGTVEPSSWSPNEIALDVRLASAATVIVNQNYETGWRAAGAGTVGAFVAPARRFWDVRAHPEQLPSQGAIGLLAVRLPPGDHHLVLRHRPPGLLLGALLSLAGVALGIAIVRRRAPPPRS